MPIRWIVLAVLFAARAATGFQFQTVGSAAPALMRDLAIGYAEIGLLLGAYLLPGAVVALPAGWLGRRFREKTLGLAGLALMVVSGIAIGHAESFATALVARIVGGVGATVVILVATKLTTDWFEQREIVLAMSLLQMSWPFGAMLALPLQAHIVQSHGSPAVMMSGALVALAVAAAFAALPPLSRESGAAAAASAKLPAAVLLPVVVAGAIWGAMNLACILFFSYAPPALAARGFSPTGAASLTSLAIWFTILAIPAGGYLVQRAAAPITAILVGGAIAAGALLMLAGGFHPTIACLIFGVAIGPLSGAILSLPAQVLEPRDRSLGFGVFYTCFYLLMAAGPPAAGRLQDAFGSPSAALVAGAVLLLAMAPLSLLFLALSKRRDPLAADAGLRAVS